MVDIILLIPLARELPTDGSNVQVDISNYLRLKHVSRNGHIIILWKDGEIVGYSECYVLNKIPSYPAVPFPVSIPNGKYLYVWALVSKPGYIKELKELGLKTIKGCTHLCYHRRKYNNRLHVERIKE